MGSGRLSFVRVSAGKAFAYGLLVLGGSALPLRNATPVAAPHPFMETHQLARPFPDSGVGLQDGDEALRDEMPSVALGLRPHVVPPPEEATGFGAIGFEAFARRSQSGALRFGSETIRLPFDPAADTYAFGPMRLKHALVETIVHAADLAGVDPRLLMAIADKESSFVVRARAPTSSATGLFQFIDSTWLHAVRDFGPRFGLDAEARALEFGAGGSPIADEAARQRILDMRNDAFLSTLFAAALLRREKEKLSARLGRPLSDAEVYLVHFLGPAGAQKFLSVLAEKPKTGAANLLPQAARSNRPIFFTTHKRKPRSLSVVQVREKIEFSLEQKLVRYRDLDFAQARASAAAPTGAQPRPSTRPGPPHGRAR